METIAEIFFRNTEKYADKIAIWCDEEEMTYREIGDFVSQYANYLTSRGVRRRDVIGIPMNNSIESVALIMAAACVGAGLAPINPTISVDQIDTAFQAGNVTHVIARSAFYKQIAGRKMPYLTGCRLCLDSVSEGMDSMRDVKSQPADRPDLTGIDGTETLILTMTSGSTGTPKPIELTQENKLQRAFAHVRLYGITENDRVLAATPLYHSLAERLVILPLLIGATSVLLPRFTPKLWMDCVEKQKVTFTIAVSAQLSQIAQIMSSPFAADLSGMRSIVSSSALLEPHVRTELIAKLQCDFNEMYGTSECSTVTNINFREAINYQNSVGRPIPEARLKILRDDGTEAETGEIGEIACKTKLLYNGYYGMPEMTKEALTADGYFKTGDLGKVDQDGYLYFCGRKKELIITGGINVYPQDVEHAVFSLPEIKECAAFPYLDERLGEVVALAVVVKEGQDLTKRAIQMCCAKKLADFQQPHKIFMMQELPKNAMGKLTKNKLPEMVAGMEG
ncbi:class I adenylate-forming enzyme family protein [Ruminococcus gauvreauii]|uniref:class I adenylate-forming enzyme family protein n=1 Tax=Ruminococcus gauvreauii TaxID=438033 RepID=UPI003983DF72